MKAILIASVVLMLFAGALSAAGQEGVLDLSTLGKKPATEPIVLPKTTLSSEAGKQFLDLSTLGKKRTEPLVPAVFIKASTPITITPSFSIQNANITAGAPTTFTLPHAVSANTTIFTPPIAIFGGA